MALTCSREATDVLTLERIHLMLFEISKQGFGLVANFSLAGHRAAPVHASAALSADESDGESRADFCRFLQRTVASLDRVPTGGRKSDRPILLFQTCH